MDWVDLALVTPTVGVLCRPWYRTFGDYARNMLPELERRLGAPNFLYKSPVPTALEVDSSEGFQYRLTQDNMVVQFVYPTNVKQHPGKFAELQIGVKERPYSELLTEVVAQLKWMMSTVMLNDQRTVTRIGVVAIASLEASAAPPGVTKFIEHVGSPWGAQKVVAAQLNVTATLSASDRCIHQLVRTEEEPESLRVQLDWQRQYDPVLTATPAKIMTEVGECIEAAKKYFEQFGRGELDYA